MNADPIAHWYRWIEYMAFGRALERRRFAFLPALAEARRILVLGEGDGRSLERLLREAPKAAIDVVELSGEMIALAKRRIGPADRVRFHQRDALASQGWPAASYDAVVTHFFLDCFTEEQASAVIRKIAAALEPGAAWILTEFTVPRGGWRRWHARLWIQTMYAFFRIGAALQAKSLPPIERLMQEAGLALVRQESEKFDLIVSELWKFKPMKPALSASLKNY